MSGDGIAGFKGSLKQVFPHTQSQRCVVHLVRNIYSLCPKKEVKNIIADYKKIYATISSTFPESLSTLSTLHFTVSLELYVDTSLAPVIDSFVVYVNGVTKPEFAS